MFDAGEVVVVDFPGVTGIKRRPAVVLSSDTYHTARPDIVVGLMSPRDWASVRDRVKIALSMEDPAPP